MKKMMAVVLGVVLAVGSIACMPPDSPAVQQSKEKQSIPAPEAQTSKASIVAPLPAFPVVTKDGIIIKAEVPDHNPDALILNVSEMVTGESIVAFEAPGKTDAVSRAPQPSLVKDLFALKGVRQVHLYPYEIHVKKGKVFTWEVLAPRVIEVVLEDLKKS